MRDLKVVLGSALLLGFILAIVDRLPAKTVEQGPSIAGVVKRVVDGDSLYVAGLETQVRLFGVDAPERDDPGYSEAKVTLTRLVLNNSVSCKQVDEDRFNRVVARCFLPDGTEVNQAMIDSGTAREYCRYSKGLYGMC